MSDIKEYLPEFVEIIKIKNESHLLETVLPENEHPVCDSSVIIKKEFDYFNTYEPNAEGLKAMETNYDNFQCKEEVHDEKPYEIPNKFMTQNQQNSEEYSENNEADEKIDISEVIVQSTEYKDEKFKIESENFSKNQKTFTQRQSPEGTLKQGKEKTQHSTMSSNSNAKINNCQFCNKTFSRKWSLDDHIVRQHKQEIKGDWKSFITSKVYTCSICNNYHTTKKVTMDRHMSILHGIINPQTIVVRTHSKKAQRKDQG